MSSPKFSIVIPLYNKENSIKAAIESVLNQSEPDFELIVVNDGSRDKSLDVVQAIVDDRITLIDKENGGVSSTRNAGIARASGEFICFLDADDEWYPDFLSTVLSLSRKFPNAAMLCPGFEIKYANRTVHPVFKSVEENKDCLVNDFFEMATSSFWIVNSSCVALKKEALSKLDTWFPEGETVYEDFDLWLRFGSRFPVAHSQKICAVYNRETDSNARKQHANKVVYSKTFMKTLIDMLESGEYSVQQKHWIQEIYDRRMVPYVFSLLMTGKRKEGRQVLQEWKKPTGKYSLYRCGLICASIMPKCVLKAIQTLRLKLL